MQSIFIKNFKSYKETDVRKFNQNINVILGSNGEGKSNFFKALSFALSDRSSLNQTQFSNNLHRGIDNNKDSKIEVEIHMFRKQQADHEQVREQQITRISKVWTEQSKEELCIDERVLSKKQYENVIQTHLSLSYSNPYNMIHQGKIHQIILMDEFELYRLLQEITGVKKFHKRKQEAQTTMKKVQSQKKQIEYMLEDLSRKLQVLQSRKQQFQYYAAEEKTKTFRMRKHYAQMLQATKQNLGKIRYQFSDVLSSLSKIEEKKEILRQQYQRNIVYINNARQKLLTLQKNYDNRYQSQVSQNIQMTSQQFSKYKKQLDSIQKQIKNNEKKLQKKDKNLNQFKQQYSQIQRRYDKLKLTNQLSSSTNKQSRQKFIQAYQQQIKQDESRIQQLGDEQIKINKQLSMMNSQHKKDRQTLEDYEYLQQKIKDLKSEKQSNQMQLKGLLLHDKNKIQLQESNLSEYVKTQYFKVRKILPYLDTVLAQNLKTNKIKGVYGYFIDFLQIDETISFAYQIAGLSKLCSLLVEDEQACNQVIKLNKKLKGKQINIIQMSYLRNQIADKKVFPKNENVKKLTNPKWIKIAQQNFKSDNPQQFKKDLQKLVNITFNNYALTSDYQTALNVSKEYYLNCITADKEIIYADGYLCKVGRDQYARDNNKISIYHKYVQKRLELQDKKRLKAQLLQKQQYLQKKDTELGQELQKVSQQFSNIQVKVREIQQIKKFGQIRKKQLHTVSKMKQNIAKGLQIKKQNLKTFQSSKNKQKAASGAQAAKIQEQYNTKTKILNKLLSESYEMEQKIESLSRKRQQVSKLISQNEFIKQSGGDSNMRQTSFAQSLQKQLNVKQQQICSIQKQLQQLEKNEKIILGDKTSIQIKLNTYEEEQKDIAIKMQEIGEISESMEQQMQQLSNSMSLSVSRAHGHSAKKKHHFSTKDKLLFEKYSSIIDNFREYKITYNDLLSAQQQIQKLINQFDNEAEGYIAKVAEQFQRQFQDIFGRIVENGSAEVRFKKVSNKVKDNAYRYRSCMVIKVSFSNQDGQTLKKWHEFSGGQKTIIAITIILALQRCQPAPFYVLDEIDSALDPMYVARINRIIAEQSINKNTQYFITSFKEDVLNFSTNIANFYLVSCQNRVSNMKQLTKQQAKQALKSIVMQN